MYAVFETGGKQYKVEAGDVLRIEKIAGEKGDKVSFDTVIVFSDETSLKTGTPYLDAATVNATITGIGKGDKLIVFKYKAKKDFRKKRGHRQPYTEIEIDGFSIGGKKFGDKPEKTEKKKAEAVEEEAIITEDVSVDETAQIAETVIVEEKVDDPAENIEAAKNDSKLTKADLMAKLDELGVAYLKSAKKDELIALLENAGK